MSGATNSATDWWARPRVATVVVDTPGWFDPHAERLAEDLRNAGHEARFVRGHAEVPEGDVAFYLSCLKITPADVLARNRLNVVVHASDLPRGRGFSPLVWQVLEGLNVVPLCMIEAADPVDSGAILMREQLVFEGHELNDEMREAMGAAIVGMCLRMMAAEAPPVGEPQAGEPTWFRRRRPEDSRLDPGKSIAEQFDLLRVVDNQRYPAFFEHRGRRYALRIEKLDDAEGEMPASRAGEAA